MNFYLIRALDMDKTPPRTNTLTHAPPVNKQRPREIKDLGASLLELYLFDPLSAAKAECGLTQISKDKSEFLVIETHLTYEELLARGTIIPPIVTEWFLRDSNRKIEDLEAEFRRRGLEIPQ